MSSKGTLDGQLVNVQGVPQGNFGALILMYPSGQHVGVTIAPDANGKFRFADLPAGDYQLRFQAAGQAIASAAELIGRRGNGLIRATGAAMEERLHQAPTAGAQQMGGDQLGRPGEITATTGHDHQLATAREKQRAE